VRSVIFISSTGEKIRIGLSPTFRVSKLKILQPFVFFCYTRLALLTVRSFMTDTAQLPEAERNAAVHASPDV